MLMDSAEEDSQALLLATNPVKAFLNLRRGMTQQMSLLLNGDFTPPLLRRLEGEDQSAKKLDGQHSGRWYQRHAEQRRTKKVLASKTKIYIVLELVSGARELEKQLKQITKEKKEAVRAQDFGKDGSHYDQKIELRDETAAILAKGKEVSKAELLKLAMNELGPIVSESDIQHIVSYASYIYILCSSISFMKWKELSGEDITADGNGDKSMATRMDLICHSGESNGSCWRKVEKMESKEKREGNSDGEQEPISKLVSTRVYFCIYEATYNRLKVVFL
ncbi:hypothetical protein F2Q69_00015520 [Brassica cretica]|uniref:Uncharacterized protein n=1 Tax=Brassica cretica TaxID=69181 RepID=A0A8S9R9C1_BRACR|nr:hypothetical protein F2Q69_00015520 [Brassica cretica]